MILFSFHCLTFTFGHLIGESLFAVFTDVADAGRAVGLEEKSEYLSYNIGECLALVHIPIAFGASVKSPAMGACSYLAPCGLFVIVATGAFVREIFAASSAVESACRYEFSISCDILHNEICANSLSIHIVASLPTKRSNT